MTLTEHLNRVLGEFDREQIRYALVGGMAMAVYGFARSTVDIDLLVVHEDVGRALSTLEALGFIFEIPPMKFHDGWLTINRRTGVFPDQPEPLMVDLLSVPLEEEPGFLAERQVASLEGCSLFVLSPEKFAVLKRLRNSKRDQDDLETLFGGDRNETSS